MSFKSYSAKPSDITKKWYIVDADGQTLGRLASQVAYVLRGKHKAIYTPHMDTGDNVIVINADKIKLTGKKELDKTYFRHTGWFGGIKESKAFEIRQKQPERLLEIAVKGMLPTNVLGRELFRHLKVYAGTAHPHEAQKPEALPNRTIKA